MLYVNDKRYFSISEVRQIINYVRRNIYYIALPYRELKDLNLYKSITINSTYFYSSESICNLIKSLDPMIREDNIKKSYKSFEDFIFQLTENYVFSKSIKPSNKIN